MRAGPSPRPRSAGPSPWPGRLPGARRPPGGPLRDTAPDAATPPGAALPAALCSFTLTPPRPRLRPACPLLGVWQRQGPRKGRSGRSSPLARMSESLRPCPAVTATAEASAPPSRHHPPTDAEAPDRVDGSADVSAAQAGQGQCCGSTGTGVGARRPRRPRRPPGPHHARRSERDGRRSTRRPSSCMPRDPAVRRGPLSTTSRLIARFIRWPRACRCFVMDTGGNRDAARGRGTGWSQLCRGDGGRGRGGGVARLRDRPCGRTRPRLSRGRGPARRVPPRRWISTGCVGVASARRGTCSCVRSCPWPLPG